MKTTKQYSVFCNGHCELAMANSKDAHEKFQEVFHANEKHKHVQLNEHLVDAEGNILSTQIVLQVSGRPRLPKVIK